MAKRHERRTPPTDPELAVRPPGGQPNEPGRPLPELNASRPYSIVDGDGMRERAQVLLAYALFVAIGVAAGVSGVLLLAQIRDYGVDRATIGLTFFTGSAGFVLAGASSGGLMHRYGTRAALLVAGSGYVLAALYVATRPPFVALVLIQLLTGYATGLLESVLNAHLTTLAKATTRLNRLHAFFGVGALVGPVLASWMLGFTTWPMVWLVIAAIYTPLTAAVIFAYPQRTDVPTSEKGERGLLSTALRDRAILLGAVMLAVYVGLELGVGNWAYSYLVEARSLGGVAAGYTVSGYWLGLTLGRFLISPVAGRLGLTAAGQMYLCLIGVTAAAALTWLVPVTAGASVGFVALGFFLGPIFPTTMAVGSQLTVASLVPTAIGVMNAGSVVGGSALPWLAGALGQGVGPWTLLPFALVLALLQLAVWWRIARRIRPATHISTVDTHAAHPEPG